MKFLLVYKKTNQTVTNNYIDNITSQLKNRGYQVVTSRFNKLIEVDNVVCELNEDSYDKLIIIGGELTINSVINRLINYDIDIPMNIFPLGCDNSFLNLVDIPENIIGIVDMIINPCMALSIQELEFSCDCDNGFYQQNSFRKLFKLNGISKGVKSISKEAKNSVKDSYTIIKELPRHSVLNYINSNSLDEEYFEIAEKNLNNGYMYILLSSTGTPTGEMVRRFTRQDYSHVSISFDEELKTIVSYNSGNGNNAPGLNQEIVDYFYQKPNANFVVYRLKASKKQKTSILNEIKRINNQGSAYNVLGFVLPYPHRQNTMYCSQFVYTTLKKAGLSYFEKKSWYVKPLNFIKYDDDKKLEYVKQVFLKDVVAEHNVYSEAK